MAVYEHPTKIHLFLGIVSFTVFLLLTVLDSIPGYEVSPYLAGFLVVTYLFLLGFGVAVTRILEAKYE